MYAPSVESIPFATFPHHISACFGFPTHLHSPVSVDLSCQRPRDHTRGGPGPRYAAGRPSKSPSRRVCRVAVSGTAVVSLAEKEEQGALRPDGRGGGAEVAARISLAQPALEVG